MKYTETTAAIYAKAAVALFKEAASGITLVKVKTTLRENRSSMKVVEAGNKLGIFKSGDNGKVYSDAKFSAADVEKMIAEYFLKSDERGPTGNRYGKKVKSSIVKTKPELDGRKIKSGVEERYTKFVDKLKSKKTLTYKEIAEIVKDHNINIGVGTALKGMNFLNTSTNTIRTKYQSMSTRRLIVLLREEVKERRLKNEAGESTKETVSRHIITPDLSASEKKQKIELAKSFTQLGEYKTAQDLLKSIN